MREEAKGVGSFTDWLGFTDAPDWKRARLLGSTFGFLAIAMYLLALVAAFAVVGRMIFDGEQVSLGGGALVAALLGAPFVVWGTVLKHRTVMFQKEGHITDRINKAVEQLGAEKTIERIGRPVTLQTGHPDYVEPSEIERSTVIEWLGKPLPELELSFLDSEGEWQAFSETVPNIEVRIGAILSLERIAQDSTRLDGGRDHIRVMEILTAYIRV